MRVTDPARRRLRSSIPTLTAFGLVLLGATGASAQPASIPTTGWIASNCGSSSSTDNVSDTSGGDQLEVVGDATNQAVFYQTDATYLYLRMRVGADPTQGTAFGSFGWSWALDVDGDLAPDASIILIGQGMSDRIEIQDLDTSNGTTATATITPVGGTTNTYARALPAGTALGGGTDWFVDVALPKATLATFGVDGAMRMWSGSSANFTGIDKDLTCASGTLVVDSTVMTNLSTSCGNGILDVNAALPSTSETCDDGNQTNGDGCSATCQTESGFVCTNFPNLVQDPGFLAACTVNWNNDGNLTCDSGAETNYGGTNAANNVAEVDSQANLAQGLSALVNGATYGFAFKAGRDTAVTNAAPATVGATIVLTGTNLPTTTISRSNTTFGLVRSTYVLSANSTLGQLSMNATGTPGSRGMLIDDVWLARVSQCVSATADSDGDGVLDTTEIPLGDTDGDGTPNYLDTDDDGDGILTSSECPALMVTCPGPAPGSYYYLLADDDGDGIPTLYECPGNATTPVTTASCRNSDSDMTADYQDPDSDGDGIGDVNECAWDLGLAQCALDTDANGTPDYRQSDDDGDGVATSTECMGTPLVDPTTCPDSDSDGAYDFRDLDSDNDCRGDGTDSTPTSVTPGVCTGSTPVCTVLASAPLVGTCVQCTGAEASACMGTTPICNTATNTCAGCDPGMGLLCPGATPICQANGSCTGCTGNADCGGATPICVAGTCVDCGSGGGDAVCATLGAGLFPVCATSGPNAGSCVECTGANTMACSPSAPLCDATLNVCVGCTADTDCTSPGLGMCSTGTCIDPNGDLDGDGLGNLVERDTIGTSYLDPDSDHDGIPDGLEVGPDPMNARNTDQNGPIDALDTDSDDDGILDADEQTPFGSPNPQNPVYDDTDLDGIPDYRDTDDDGDGIATSTECPGTAPVDPTTCANSNGDTTPDYLDPDDDGDGIPTFTECGYPVGTITTTPATDCRNTDSGLPSGDTTPDYLDLDSDGDTLTDASECPSPMPACLDTDGSGVPNYRDPDDDGDGILTSTEISDSHLAAVNSDDVDGTGGVNWLDNDADGDRVLDGADGTQDLDNDGRPDYLDPSISGLDSDQDGLSDAQECPATENVCPDHDNDGTPDYLDPDDDGDGIATSVELGMNTDFDPLPNYLDADDDGDGLTTATECPLTPPATITTTPNVDCLDTDGDTTRNFLDTDDDGDGIQTLKERNDSMLSQVNSDDVDGMPGPNWLDTDADGDGFGDAMECPDPTAGCPDADGDGRPSYLDANEFPGDTDGDGVPDSVECQGAATCDGVDHDGDGVPDYKDTDDDGDGIATSGELGSGGTPQNSDSDTIPDYLDPDDDGDGIPTKTERTDSNSPAVASSDVDGTPGPNWLDTDADGDSLPDMVECTTPTTGCEDLDGDGKPNYLDTDDDGDGIPTLVEIADAQRPGGNDDVDGDGIVNWLDPDADGDGIPDNVECPDPLMCLDLDHDGIPDYLEVPRKQHGGVVGGAVCAVGDVGRDDGNPLALLFVLGTLGLVQLRRRRS